MKVDIHTHLLPAELPRFAERYGYGGFITLEHHAPCRARMLRDDGKFFREIESNCWDPARRLTECDAAGVTLSGEKRDSNLFLSRLDEAVNEAIDLRNKLESQNAVSVEGVQEKERYFQQATALTARLRRVADVLIGMAFDVDEAALISADAGRCRA